MLSTGRSITGLALAAVALAALVGVASPHVGSDARIVAALFPPWWSPAATFRAAATAGEVVRTGAVRTVVVVRSDAPGLSGRLTGAGAILVLDPTLLGLCGEPDK